MIYSGKAITVQAIDDGIAELCFDLQDDSVNKFNALTVNELKEATAAIAADSSLNGVIVTSGKPVFIVGADIMEFGALFGASEDEITDRILQINLEVFNAFEDLSIPTVAACTVAIRRYGLLQHGTYARTARAVGHLEGYASVLSKRLTERTTRPRRRYREGHGSASTTRRQ